MVIRERLSKPAFAVAYTHKITTNQFEAKMQVSGERVVNAEPVVHWTIGKRLDYVRESYSRNGYAVEELPKPARKRK